MPLYWPNLSNIKDICDTGILASDNQCIFALTGDQPDDWLDAVEHDVKRNVGDDFYR